MKTEVGFHCIIFVYLTAFVPDALVDAIPPRLASAPGSTIFTNKINSPDQCSKKQKHYFVCVSKCLGHCVVFLGIRCITLTVPLPSQVYKKVYQ